MVKPYYIKSAHSVKEKKNLFADVLQNSCS